ncbi:MAG TPA: hypothetical protein PLL10_08925, partial [Elusimicrobiales bacterium]|nr:hypothetical protein [Elusimicrobiales bacterium]
MSLLKGLSRSKLLVLETLFIGVFFLHVLVLSVPLGTEEAAAFSNISAAGTNWGQAGLLPSFLLLALAKSGLGSSFGLHLLCVALHALNAMLLASLSSQLFGLSLTAGAACGFLFGLWPGASFALFFPFSLGQLLAATVVLTALWDYSSNKQPWRIIAWTTAGLLCHPSALSIPLLCLALDLFHHKDFSLPYKTISTLIAATIALTTAMILLFKASSPRLWPSASNFGRLLLGAFAPLHPFTSLAGQPWLCLVLIICLAIALIYGSKHLSKYSSAFILYAFAVTALLPVLPALLHGDSALRNLILEHNAYLTPLP